MSSVGKKKWSVHKADLFVFMLFWEKWCRQPPQTLSYTFHVCDLFFFLLTYSLSLNDYCSYWLCISACALAAPLSAKQRISRAPCLFRTAKPPCWAQTPTHTWLLTSTHSSYGSVKFYLPFPLHLPLLFLLCVPCVIFGGVRRWTGWVFSPQPLFFPKVFSMQVSLPNASVCPWMGCSFSRILILCLFAVFLCCVSVLLK